jgi:hypothetical protein
MRKQNAWVVSALTLLLALPAFAADLQAPPTVAAGTGFSITSGGSGEATFYLVGPAQLSKRKVQLGSGIAVQPDEVRHTGRYTAIVCASSCDSVHFYVTADNASRLSLIVHPSRVPVDQVNAISAVAFVFDKFHNIVFSPSSVKFTILPTDGHEISATRPTDNGIGWVRLTSAKKEGPVKLEASVGDMSEVRVVQQVASEACNLRITAERVKGQLQVQTDPVRDCSGNPVPDGTVVTFTKFDSAGKTTVDAPVKRGIARVDMPVSGNAQITAASGVVTGNELRVAGRP